MPVKRNRSRLLAIASQVYRSRIEVIHPAPDCFVNQPVDLILVDHLATVSIILQRPAHTAISEKPDSGIIRRHLATFAQSRSVLFCFPALAGSKPKSGRRNRCCLKELFPIHN